jgi:hypothetical protein
MVLVLLRLQDCGTFAIVAPTARYRMGRNGKEEQRYTQASLEGLADLEQAESQFANCLILSLPVYTDTGKEQEWIVTVHAQPSIFQPDADIQLIASAHNDLAKRSQRKSFKPGDRVALTGVLRVDTISFPSGETQTIHRLALTTLPEMVAKEKRVSTTVFAQNQRR